MTRSKIERDTQSVPTPLRDSFSIWRLLNRKGRLSPKTHDERFVADLRKTLEVPRGEEIDAFLKRASPNTTAFTIAVLNAFEPMGRMLSDIYAMFARHGLKESDDKVLIEFDFGAAKDKLQFDSDHFRRTLQGLSKLRQAMYSYEFYAKDLWEIARQIGDALADSNAQPQAQNVYKRTLGKSKQGELASFLSEPHSQAYTIWLKGSLDVARNWDRWPYVAPPPFPEFSVGDAVAEAMTPFVSATQRLCEVSSRYPTYEAMRVAADRDNPSTEPGTNLRATVNAWGLSVSRLAQSDRLGEYCLRLIWHVFELAPLEGEARMDLARRIAQIVEANSNRVEAFHLTNAIEDLLDLPMWKYRHQIYSIWLVTVIERAFGDPGQFLLTGRDGHLIFAFVETPVAQLRANGVEMELVSELRTSSGNLELTGKGRTSSVQPDYVIRSTDGSTIGRVRYVLEAKQYAKASLRNFSRALRDYAVVHTNAVVALANYGPMPSTVTAELAALTAKMKDKRVIERCKAFGNVEPTYPASVLAIRNHIRSALMLLPAPSQLQQRMLIIDVSGSMADVIPNEQEGFRQGVWSAIASTGMPLLLVAKGFKQAYEGRHSFDAARLSLEHLQSGALGMDEVDVGKRKGAILLTDESGLTETAIFHQELAAVIVLRNSVRASMHVNPKYQEELEWTVPELLQSTSWTLMTSG